MATRQAIGAFTTDFNGVNLKLGNLGLRFIYQEILNRQFSASFQPPCSQVVFRGTLVAGRDRVPPPKPPAWL